MGDATEPISTVWGVRGEAYVGFVRALGVNGNATLSIFVALFLVAP